MRKLVALIVVAVVIAAGVIIVINLRSGPSLPESTVIAVPPEGQLYPAVKATVPPEARPVADLSAGARWTTRGTDVVNPNGNAIQLHGINVSGLEYGDGDRSSGAPRTGYRPPPYDPFAAVKRWGFNVVRVPVSWSNLEPRPPTTRADGTVVHHWNQDYINLMDLYMLNFGKHGIPVIYTFHQNDWSPVTGGGGLPAWLYPASTFGSEPDQCKLRQDFFVDKHGWDQAAQAEAFLAKHFEKFPWVMGVDIFNEPYRCVGMTPAQMNLDEMYEKFGTAIHEANPDLLLIVEDAATCRFPDFGLSRKPDLPNLVYSFHMYCPAWQPYGQTLVDKYLNRARDWDVPLFMGEFAAFGAAAGSEPNSDLPPPKAIEVATALTYCREHDVSWTYWDYDGPTSLIFMNGQSKPNLLRALRTGM